MLPKSSYAKKDKATYFAGFFNEPDGNRAGAEVGIAGKGRNFGARVSGVINQEGTNITRDGYTKNELYAGLSAFGFMHFDLPINPDIGLGAFVGKTSQCDQVEQDVYGCEESASLAIYPELGLEFNIADFQIAPYVRRYFDTSDDSTSGNVYGINFAISF